MQVQFQQGTVWGSTFEVLNVSEWIYGKKCMTDVATMKQLLRIIQSIPSSKAEPFKIWLSQVGAERIGETIDPELTIDRALATYLLAETSTTDISKEEEPTTFDENQKVARRGKDGQKSLL